MHRWWCHATLILLIALISGISTTASDTKENKNDNPYLNPPLPFIYNYDITLDTDEKEHPFSSESREIKKQQTASVSDAAVSFIEWFRKIALRFYLFATNRI